MSTVFPDLNLIVGSTLSVSVRKYAEVTLSLQSVTQEHEGKVTVVTSGELAMLADSCTG